METMVRVAANGEFKLYELHTVDGWINLKLIRETGSKSVPKRNWWIAWNGERLARNKDAKTLAEYNPKIYRWVMEVLQSSTSSAGAR